MENVPLSGMKVLELASVLAGPSVGQFLAEMGAEVIKIENPGTGDVTRSWKAAAEQSDDRSAYFSTINWGKKSLCVDLKSLVGQQQLLELVREADIVLTSFKPGDATQLGADYEQLSANNDGLIYGAITGYGEVPRVGYDAVLQAETGWMSMNGAGTGDPVKMPVALIDILAAHHLKEGILLALLQRERTGKGCKVEVSLFDAAIVSLANQANNWLMGKQVPQRTGSLHPNIAPYGETFATRDDKLILLAIGTDKQFRELCDLLQISWVAGDERFSTNALRVGNRKILADYLADAIVGMESEELAALCMAKQIPAGIVQNLAEVFSRSEANDLVLRSGNLTGLVQYAGTEFGTRTLTPPPKLGNGNQ